MFKHLAVLMLLLGTMSIVYAQLGCTELVEQAISVTDDACAQVGRNQACYGNGRIDIELQPGAELDSFASSGDMISVVDIESLALSELNEVLNEWGIALLSVQANLPNTLPGQNVLILLFGESEIVNAGEALQAFYFSSGIGAAACNEAPNGMLIQSPKDVGPIELTINDVGVTLGSTAYIIAEPEGLMTFTVLEGSSTLSVGEESVALQSGEFSTIELDENLTAISAPSEPQPVEGNLTLPVLPVALLPLDPLDPTGGDDSVGHIAPMSGNWTYVIGAVDFTGGCPPAMVSAMQSSGGLSETFFVGFGGDDWDFETWFNTFDVQGTLGDGDFSQPEPNTYQFNAVVEEVNYQFELSVVSPTQLEGRTVLDFSGSGMNCVITIPYTAELAD